MPRKRSEDICPICHKKGYKYIPNYAPKRKVKSKETIEEFKVSSRKYQRFYFVHYDNKTKNQRDAISNKKIKTNTFQIRSVMNKRICK